MNVGYLRRTIRDQVDRAQSLADEIPRRPGHAALGRLAASCRATLEDEVRLLEEAHSNLGGGDASRAAAALAAIKHGASKIGTVEAFGMPPLHCPSEQAVFLNDVLTAIHSRIGLPFPCPAVSCTSNAYYFSHQPTNTVYVPLSEAHFCSICPTFTTSWDTSCCPTPPAMQSHGSLGAARPTQSGPLTSGTGGSWAEQGAIRCPCRCAAA